MKRIGLIIVIVFFIIFISVIFSFYQQRKVEVLGGVKTIMERDLEPEEEYLKEDKDYLDEIIVYSEYDLAYTLELHKNYSLAGMNKAERAKQREESRERKELFQRLKAQVKQEVVGDRFKEDIILHFYHRDVMMACAKEKVFDVYHPRQRHLPFIYVVSTFRDQGYIRTDQYPVLLPAKEGSAETVKVPKSGMLLVQP